MRLSIAAEVPGIRKEVTWENWGYFCVGWSSFWELKEKSNEFISNKF